MLVDDALELPTEWIRSLVGIQVPRYRMISGHRMIVLGFKSSHKFGTLLIIRNMNPEGASKRLLVAIV